MSAAVSSGLEALDSVLASGFPNRSAILIVGPPGIGKEAICYSFLSPSPQRGELPVFVSRHSIPEILDDAKGYGIKLEAPVTYVDCSGGTATAPAIGCNLNDLTELSLVLKKLAAQQGNVRIRLVMDILSPLLLLKHLDVAYRFFNSLLIELRKFDGVVLATLEDGMHDPKEAVSFEQLFDGVIEMRLYEEALKVLPLLRIKKMRGLPLRPGYFNFRFSSNGSIEIDNYVR